MSVRVRFAPSPTGSLHLGNALTAVANRRFADAHGGVVVLRIDDTDPTRNVEGGEDAILGDLGWLGVGFDEGPVRQSERGDVHAEAVELALAGGAAARDDDGSVRLAGDGTTLLRCDGTATYQLASVADDLDLRITHVIRGSDHRP
ncbi:MAG TPA: glutamate--tRNA ligase family protein, partial [Gaiellaceae bacterium]|nr:glutamate--tRNA ligase family protein [Gaiellaceae bacterium]